MSYEGNMEYITGREYPDPLAGINGLLVHNNVNCLGRNCCIHNPSDTIMKTWPLNWRADRKIMERQCPCGVGHPDVDDMWYRTTIGDNSTIHGCCPRQCCELAYGEFQYTLGG